jgi:hypothetical protein
MDSVEMLLNHLPNSFLVHLVRDPRAVALSRLNLDATVRSKYSQQAPNESDRLVREASIYCRQVVADVRHRQHLEDLFPGRLYSLTYEQLIRDPAGSAKNIYRLAGVSPIPGTLRHFAGLSRNGTMKARRWSNGSISEHDFQLINRHCREMLQLYPEYSSVVPQSFKAAALSSQSV